MAVGPVHVLVEAGAREASWPLARSARRSRPPPSSRRRASWRTRSSAPRGRGRRCCTARWRRSPGGGSAATSIGSSGSETIFFIAWTLLAGPSSVVSDTISFGMAQSPSSWPRSRKTCWRRLDPHGAEAAEVVLQLLSLFASVAAAVIASSDAAARRFRGRPLPMSSFRSAARGSTGRRRPGVAATRAGSGAGAPPFADHLQRGRRGHLRPAQVNQRTPSRSRSTTGAQDSAMAAPTVPQEGQQLLVLDEVDLADHAELVQGVEEQVDEAGPPGPPAGAPPAHDLRRRALDGGVRRSHSRRP